jgi:hypothetical protein
MLISISVFLKDYKEEYAMHECQIKEDFEDFAVEDSTARTN